MTNKAVTFDLHTHHDRCGHAMGSLRDYIKRAMSQGLDIIGLSDHAPFFGVDVDHYKPWVAMAKSEFANYIAEAIRLRNEYRDRKRSAPLRAML